MAKGEVDVRLLLPCYIKLLKAVIKQAEKDLRVADINREERLDAVDFITDGRRDNYLRFIRSWEDFYRHDPSDVESKMGKLE